jgi:hypothetical protein
MTASAKVTASATMTATATTMTATPAAPARPYGSVGRGRKQDQGNTRRSNLPGITDLPGIIFHKIPPDRERIYESIIELNIS